MNQGFAGYKSAAAITQFRIVKLFSTDTVTVAAAATDTLLSVNKTNITAAGQHVDIADIGEIVWCEAGAAVGIGARITSDASGRGVTAAPAAGTNNGIVGIAMSVANAAGEYFRLVVTPQTFQG